MHVQTVLGPVDADALGRVLTHEHLTCLTPTPWFSEQSPEPGSWIHGGLVDDRVDTAVSAVAGLTALGFGAIVDVTPTGLFGHDVRLLTEISERSGIHVIAGTSVYLETYSPAWALSSTLDELQARFVADARSGIGDTGIRAGILGEQATGLNEITPHEEKCLRAAARAHYETGLPINTHTTHGTMALEQIAILRDEAVDLSRVVIGHMDIRPAVSDLTEVLDTGVTIAFDTFGKQYWDFVVKPLPADLPEGAFEKSGYHRPDEARISALLQLVQRGYAEQIVLSTDITGTECYLNPHTHGRFGYSYLGREIVPRLVDAGISHDDIEQMLRHNPAQLLAA